MCSPTVHLFTSNSSVPPVGTRCDCGRVTWMTGPSLFDLLPGLDATPCPPIVDDGLEDLWRL